ncbi:FAD-dependent oxidoreductase [Collinsella sp. AM23-17]|uniref:FAD-dependent oxidoreductase n=1 Tax=Collinsella sp. AM23-17 TaxID=2292030 RepID=UPI000E498DCD|nr:FAD-binding protein [Collinsella sp. AM23-17]RHF98468.1 FAD-dependent oxidoreductase [Collinsella sp. AM23-17]
MESTDVLVIGSGIAGLCAAIEAARTGATVTVASAGKTMSGSSFFPGTWGLGLIGPVDEGDEQNLIDTIQAVGGGVADPELVQTFAHGIPQAIEWLEQDLGVELQRPQSAESAQQKQFIPCFDHKTRMWRGLTRKPLEDALTTRIESLGIRLLPRHELIDLVEDTDGKIVGATLYDRTNERLVPMAVKATIIAAGGTGGLFERSLTSADVLSSSQAIALAHGASLTNIEFMQMMPGFIEPKRNLVFNEKTWRYVKFDQPVDNADDKLDDLLEQRSGYGPFTSRLDSRAIDLAIDEAGAEGLALHYDFPREDVPEFVQTFATWLQDEHGIAPTDEMRVAMYAHAANGGIKIDKTAYTGVEGLYACGEATGGMHGADRIGGLSSANGIVFGRIAGASAARAALDAPEAAAPMDIALPQYGIATTDAERLTHSLKHTMSTYCMINRTEAGLSKALQQLESLKDEATALSKPHANDSEIATLARLQSQNQLATEMVKAMRKRTESLGSHYRSN